MRERCWSSKYSEPGPPKPVSRSSHLKNQLIAALYCAAALIGRFFTSAYRKATGALSEATAFPPNLLQRFVDTQVDDLLKAAGHG